VMGLVSMIVYIVIAVVEVVRVNVLLPHSNCSRGRREDKMMASVTGKGMMFT
jgi:hypothetical protein